MIENIRIKDKILNHFFLSFFLFIFYQKNCKNMSKIYQPIVIEESENLLIGLVESKFFDDYEISDLTFARQYILDIVNEKYILGLLGDETDELFSEDEFTKILQELVAGSVLYELKNQGYLNSYEDENTEETFFLTPKGKKHLEKEKKKKT